MPTGMMTSWVFISLNEPVCRSQDSKFSPTRGTWPLDSQYSHNNLYDTRTAGASPLMSPVTDTSSTRSHPPGFTSRAMRSRTRRGSGSCQRSISQNKVTRRGPLGNIHVRGGTEREPHQKNLAPMAEVQPGYRPPGIESWGGRGYGWHREVSKNWQGKPTERPVGTNRGTIGLMSTAVT